MALVVLSVVEQRLDAVRAVLSGASVVEVAGQVGVSRQSVHGWVRRYLTDGVSGLADRSHPGRRHGRPERDRLLGRFKLERCVAGVCPRIIRVNAKNAKLLRAKPIAGLYEKHLIHHVGQHPLQEDQMTTWCQAMTHRNRVDAMVHSTTDLAAKPPAKPGHPPGRSAARQKTITRGLRPDRSRRVTRHYSPAHDRSGSFG